MAKKDIKELTKKLQKLHINALISGDTASLEKFLASIEKDKSYTKAIIQKAATELKLGFYNEKRIKRGDLIKTISQTTARDIRTRVKQDEIKRLWGNTHSIDRTKPFVAKGAGSNRNIKEIAKRRKSGRRLGDLKHARNLKNHTPAKGNEKKTAKLLRRTVRTGAGLERANEVFNEAKKSRHFTKNIAGKVIYDSPKNMTRDRVLKDVSYLLERRRQGKVHGQYWKEQGKKSRAVKKTTYKPTGKAIKVLKRLKAPGLIGAGLTLAYAAYSAYSSTKAKAAPAGEQQKAALRKQITGAKPTTAKPRKGKARPKAKPREKAGRYIWARSKNGKKYKRRNPHY